MISLPHARLRVDCEYNWPIERLCVKTNTASRFAFVEYESHRDADDAYYEMHNKPMGRNDLLKIEVSGITNMIDIRC